MKSCPEDDGFRCAALPGLEEKVVRCLTILEREFGNGREGNTARRIHELELEAGVHRREVNSLNSVIARISTGMKILAFVSGAATVALLGLAVNKAFGG